MPMTLVFNLKVVQLFSLLHRTFAINVINLSPRWGRRYCWATKEYKQGLLRGKKQVLCEECCTKIHHWSRRRKTACSANSSSLFFFMWLHRSVFCWHCLSSSPFQVSLPQIQPQSSSCIISTPPPWPNVSKLWAAVSWQRTVFKIFFWSNLDFCRGEKGVKIRMGLLLG